MRMHLVIVFSFESRSESLEGDELRVVIDHVDLTGTCGLTFNHAALLVSEPTLWYPVNH